MLWRSISDAIINKQEMIRAIKKLQDEVRIYFAFVTLQCGGENGYLPDPGTLKHLSRCSVRQQLGKNIEIPYNKLDLDIPRSLISYINLEEEEEYNH
ncbi:hypothetical protein AVEN_37567-1 [Araneus ventricosus]|uniref:SOCS box domain-containing protein n=1 Tax=Araneus ventricosus TaxID=182803 RepID=A0A4Y1ZQW6_ARAVE|nr:hypothetical protein AVEN_34808-1 [Araneus ventricosus]GBL62473.1 hypothetical protein AVEN_37567-1 [Araneus ventricosus]